MAPGGVRPHLTRMGLKGIVMPAETRRTRGPGTQLWRCPGQKDQQARSIHPEGASRGEGAAAALPGQLSQAVTALLLESLSSFCLRSLCQVPPRQTLPIFTP